MKFSHVTKEKENRTQHASTPVYTVYTVYTGAQQVHQDTYAPAPREVAPLQQPRRQQKGNEKEQNVHGEGENSRRLQGANSKSLLPRY